jgi:hypothetical protein
VLLISCIEFLEEQEYLQAIKTGVNPLGFHAWTEPGAITIFVLYQVPIVEN